MSYVWPEEDYDEWLPEYDDDDYLDDDEALSYADEEYQSYLDDMRFEDD